MLRIDRDLKGAITQMGGDEPTIARSKVFYRALKKLVVHPEAKANVTHVEGNNPYEACTSFTTASIPGMMRRPRRSS